MQESKPDFYGGHTATNIFDGHHVPVSKDSFKTHIAIRRKDPDGAHLQSLNLSPPVPGVQFEFQNPDIMDSPSNSHQNYSANPNKQDANGLSMPLTESRKDWATLFPSVAMSLNSLNSTPEPSHVPTVYPEASLLKWQRSLQS